MVSIFNDVIGPVMRGPSSSHCAAALRIGRLARDLMDGQLNEVLVEFDRSGSLPTTHESQGSDMGLFGGLLGWDADDERLPDSAKFLADAGVHVRIETVDVGDPHPNTYRLTLRSSQVTHSLIAISTGGGMMEVIELDDIPISICGGYHETLLWTTPDAAARVAADVTHQLPVDELVQLPCRGQMLIQIKSSQFVPQAWIDEQMQRGDIVSARKLGRVLPVPSRRDMSVPFTSCAEMLQYAAGVQTSLWRLAVEYESTRGGLSDAEVVQMMVRVVRILRKSIASGLAGTTYDDRVLGFQSGRFRELMQSERLLDAGALNRIILYVTALMEVKSSMGVIVAAPTAGACAALPGAVIGMAEALGRT
ncbi:MAG TPA: L-serine ammonia-lyase, iron-sulfur-dependent, subunit alpha, partial [Pirellulaceae bacterium]|nr:L-serine ammonia-lyase, iron-sulfur-dependent, subunit alpha [Pirellulaceae bacterium]